MKNLLYILIAFFIFNLNAQTIKIGEAELPKETTFSKETLILNGAGLRQKMWFNLYAGALYLKKKNKNASEIVDSNDLMLIKLHILSSLVSKEKLLDALEKGIRHANSDEDLKKHDENIKTFISFIADKIEVNDVFNLVSVPDFGIQLYKNDLLLGAIGNTTFKKLLFNIWLANKPIDKGLKQKMLGN